MDLRKQFGARLRELRKAAGLTQQELGELANVSYKFVGAIERGTENPSLLLIERLARGLDVEPVELFVLEHHDDPGRVKARAKKMLDELPPEELKRLYRVMRVMTS